MPSRKVLEDEDGEPASPIKVRLSGGRSCQCQTVHASSCHAARKAAMLARMLRLLTLFSFLLFLGLDSKSRSVSLTPASLAPCRPPARR